MVSAIYHEFLHFTAKKAQVFIMNDKFIKTVVGVFIGVILLPILRIFIALGLNGSSAQEASILNQFTLIYCVVLLIGLGVGLYAAVKN